MRALYCREFGPEANLRVEEVDDPVLPPGHVMIEVRAAGLNFPDLLCVRGEYQFKPPLPFVPGGEGAGVIIDIADDVSGFEVGNRVCFNGLTGAFSTKVAVPAVTIAEIPDDMPFEQAGGLTLVYGTSYYALKQRARLQAGETVLVLGAAGGVGLAAVELAKAMGAKVIAAASTDEKLAVTREHGADETVNYSTEDLKARVKELTGGQGVDVVYDPVGGDLAELAFRTIGWEGRYLVIGFAASPDIPRLPLNLPLLKGASAVGVFWGAWVMRDMAGHHENMAELFDMYQSGKIRPHVAGTYALEDFMDAFNEISGRKAIGKVILTP